MREDEHRCVRRRISEELQSRLWRLVNIKKITVINYHISVLKGVCVCVCGGSCMSKSVSPVHNRERERESIIMFAKDACKWIYYLLCFLRNNKRSYEKRSVLCRVDVTPCESVNAFQQEGGCHRCHRCIVKKVQRRRRIIMMIRPQLVSDCFCKSADDVNVTDLITGNQAQL